MPLPVLSTRNGTGTALLGVRSCDDGSFWATAWRVVWYLPIRPISRHRVRIGGVKNDMQVLGAMLVHQATTPLVLLEDAPLDRAEIRRTCTLGWFVVPALLFTPALLTVIFWASLVGLALRFGLQGGQLQGAAALGSALWLALGVQVVAASQQLPKPKR